MTARDGGSSHSGVLRAADAATRGARARADVERPNFRWVLNVENRIAIERERTRARRERRTARVDDDDDDDDDDD